MATPMVVDSSIWWDPFTDLLNELESASLSSDLPPHLVKKLNDSYPWLVDSVSMFKLPNAKSNEALNSAKLKIGEHELTIRPDLKSKAIQISSYLNLDEVQSYILLERSLEQSNAVLESEVHEFVHVILLQYYIERQCLLKCIKGILAHALYIGSSLKDGCYVREVALKFISDGLERRLICVLEDLLSSTYPEQMDVGLFTSWAEEMLIEDNLILETLFLVYYESFGTCNGERWRTLCLLYKGILSGSYNLGKLAVSAEAQRYSCNAIIQLLLILMETLNLESLLQMVHDGVPFRPGASSFSLTDIQEMDAIVSGLNSFEIKELGPLVLAWAIFLCLVSSLPETDDNSVLKEIDHVGYVSQAIQADSLSYFLEILQSDVLKECEGPVTGYRSVLRTSISAFIASYEINLQLEGTTLSLILEILCKVYRGEESLCTQFWDRKSFVDGPVRCLLCNLEGEFPLRTAELIRLLSSLCEGTWPAECVYNFLDKSVGISTLFEITSDSLVDNISQTVETRVALHVPGLEGLIIPSKTRGHVLKVVRGSTALVRWEFAQSAVVVLLLRLAHGIYSDNKEEVYMILELLSRMVSFNKAVCFALLDIGNSLHVQEAGMNDQLASNVRVVEILCNLVRSSQHNSVGAAVMSMGVDILAKLLRCSPSQVTAMALKTNILDLASRNNGSDIGYSSSGSWLLSGNLAKMVLIDCEKNDNGCALVISVLDFTRQLVETGMDYEVVVPLAVFSLQYILANHEYWKYKERQARWRVTLKVLEVMKACIMFSSFTEKSNDVIRDILLSDSSIHTSLFRIVCTTTQTLEKLCVSRFFELREIEGWQLAMVSVLDILNMVLTKFSKDMLSSFPVFHQAMLSSTTKPISLVVAVASLLSYFQNTAIQIGAAKVLSMLLTVAGQSQVYLFGNACFGLDDKQIADLKHSVRCILLEQSAGDEGLSVAIIKLLTSAAFFQPAFLAAMFTSKDDADIQLNGAENVKQPIKGLSLEAQATQKPGLVDAILQYVERYDDLINSNPCMLLGVLNFLKALWQGAGQYANILDLFKSSGKLWKQLSDHVSVTAKQKESALGSVTEKEREKLALELQCQSTILDIIACDIFLNKKLLYNESLVKQAMELAKRTESAVNAETSAAKDCDPKDNLLNWFNTSVLGSLIQSSISYEHEAEQLSSMKIAASLLTVNLIVKLETSSTGAMSVSLVEKIHVMSEKLSSHPAFSGLLAQYSKRGYSEVKEIKTLIFNDLYYLLQGELDGRTIVSGPFKELSWYLAEYNFWQKYKQKYEGDLYATTKDVYLFDTEHVRRDLGIDMWDYSMWSTSKANAETMLHCMRGVNSMVLLSNSRLSSLKALTSLLTVNEDDSPKGRTSGRNITEQLNTSHIEDVCQCLCAAVESMAPGGMASEDTTDFLRAQVELIFHLMRSTGRSSITICRLVLKTSASCLKTLSDLRTPVAGVKKTVKLLLELLLLAVSFRSLNSGSSDMEENSEIFNGSVGLLPIFCSFVNEPELLNISLTTMDVILRSFLTPDNWFPIIQKHLQLQYVIRMLQDKNNVESVPIIMKFFVTIARVRGGAEMLLDCGFLSTLRVLFTELSESWICTLINNEKGPLLEKTEKNQHIWGLGVAVVTAIIQSLGDGASCIRTMENVIPYLFSEKAHLISYYLSAPDFPSDDRYKKRPRTQRTWTSLASLKETEHTLMLMCVLARHWRLWNKAMKEQDSSLRETSIHLLAFISQGAQRLRESPNKTSFLLCPPVLKEEFDCCKKPPFINSRYGWFGFSPLGCEAKPKISGVSFSTALVIKDPAIEISDPASQTQFSDSVALQIYRVSFLLLKFLCLQAESAAKRAEETGFVDLANFPELPMPDILHGLQDQAINVVTEQCEINKLKQIDPKVQHVCALLLEIMEMALYLELCVLQICGLRPVSGRVEDFSKEIKRLVKAMEGHAFLKSSMESLKQIISLVYPGLL